MTFTQTISSLKDIYQAHSILINSIVALFLGWVLFEMGWFTKSDYQPKGKHCYITGGTQGLGKALAESLVRQGAHVTVVARDVAKGKKVEAELKSIAQPDQIIQFISADLTSPLSSLESLVKASEPFNGRVPDYIYLCAGFSKPKYMVDSSLEEFQAGFDGTYWVSAYTAQAAVKLMVKQRVLGKIVFVSSFLGYTSFAGYTNYSPGKYALRGLADALRSEMLLHDIKIHIFMPCGIAGPGYEAENEFKPAVTLKIEEDDTQIPPEQCAKALETGLRKGYYQITDNIICDFARLRSNGGVPTNNFFADCFYLLVSSCGLPIWRMTADATVRKGRNEVHADYEARGIYEQASK
uniref:3-dehydrosphinganine reductase n=2 Tax=Kwoniella dejecticola CBS 10117 TaxID=1296121 RepID=A0A1A6A1V6_9TREE|nr:3-ketodihydrosphingosine reductase TSC10 [Kwoniella dejecticola CBS 10117]OBR84029.1 3-ketodihydrosphingosine reductase TSC10 [Kwoniella dejecticola CBS 10117]